METFLTNVFSSTIYECLKCNEDTLLNTLRPIRFFPYLHFLSRNSQFIYFQSQNWRFGLVFASIVSNRKTASYRAFRSFCSRLIRRSADSRFLCIPLALAVCPDGFFWQGTRVFSGITVLTVPRAR